MVGRVVVGRVVAVTESHLTMYLRWSLCTLYLHACLVGVTEGDSDLCCYVCVTFFEH